MVEREPSEIGGDLEKVRRLLSELKESDGAPSALQEWVVSMGKVAETLRKDKGVECVPRLQGEVTSAWQKLQPALSAESFKHNASQIYLLITLILTKRRGMQFLQ